MNATNLNSVISVVPVSDFEKALGWYIRLFKREPDVVPMEGIAEWQVIENAWIQLSTDPENTGKTTVVLGVNDIEEQYQICLDSGITIGEIVEYPGVIKLANAVDPEGNKISFVQDLSMP